LNFSQGINFVPGTSIDCLNHFSQFKNSSIDNSVNKEQVSFNQVSKNIQQPLPDLLILNKPFPNDKEPQNSLEQTNSPTFTIKFLQTLAEQFPIVLRRFFVKYIPSSNCLSSVKGGISARELIRSKHEKLLSFINQFSSVFCSIVNENVIVFLILSSLSRIYSESSESKKS
jgi:hypothetical protein